MQKKKIFLLSPSSASSAWLPEMLAQWVTNWLSDWLFVELVEYGIVKGRRAYSVHNYLL